jgi:hypothetical protein
MTTRRRLLVFGLLATVTGLSVGGSWLLWLRPTTAITRENAAKIKEGMTLAEVEAILGPERNGWMWRPLVTDGIKFQQERGELEGDLKGWYSSAAGCASCG